MLRRILDYCAITGSILAVWIPPLAGLIAIIWTLARLYEMWAGVPFHKTPLVRKLKGDKCVDL